MVNIILRLRYGRPLNLIAMKIFLTIVSILLSSILYGQQIEYAYDNAGNRVQRKIKTSTCRLPMPVTLIASERREMEVSIAPNPTKGKLEVNIQEDENIDQMYEVHIYDDMGREVFRETKKSSLFKVDLSKEAAGVYFLKIVNGEEVTNLIIRKQ